MKIAVITDSGSNLPLNYIESKKNLSLLPLQINVEGVYYRDILEIKADVVYNKLKEKHITTSLPKMEDYVKRIEEFKSAGYTDILVISISSGLSGTFNALRNVNIDVEDIHVHLYDTKTLSMGQGYLVEEAIKLIESGETSIEVIMKRLDDLRFNHTFSMFTVETLKWLRKGGRIGLVEGTLGDILHVKPIISVNDEGVYHTLSKGFGMKRTYITMRKKLKEFYGDDFIELHILYGDNLEEAQAMEKKLTVDLNVKKVTLTPFTPVLGVHTGPKVLAICSRRI